MNIIKSRPTRRQVFSYMRRLIAYVVGMFFIASGVSLSRSTNWGISTVNSIPCSKVTDGFHPNSPLSLEESMA